jgi:hypothetical protein
LLNSKLWSFIVIYILYAIRMLYPEDEGSVLTSACRKTELCNKGHTMTGYKGPRGKQMYSYTLSLTSSLDGISGQRHDPAALTPRKTRYPLYMRLGGSQGRSEGVEFCSEHSVSI